MNKFISVIVVILVAVMARPFLFNNKKMSSNSGSPVVQERQPASSNKKVESELLDQYLFPNKSVKITIVSKSQDKILRTYKFDKELIGETEIQSKLPFRGGVYQTDEFIIDGKSIIIKWPVVKMLDNKKASSEGWAFREYYNKISNKFSQSMIVPTELKLNEKIMDGMPPENWYWDEFKVVEKDITLETKIGKFSPCIRLQKGTDLETVACKNLGILKETTSISKSITYEVEKIENL